MQLYNIYSLIITEVPDIGEAMKLILEEKGIKVPSRPATGAARPSIENKMQRFLVTGNSVQSVEGKSEQNL